MASPDRIRKSQLRLLMAMMPPCVLVMNTMAHAMTRTTMVRMAVAKLEFTPSIPILARIDVKAAKTAESNAKINHMICFPLFIAFCLCITITILLNRGIFKQKNLTIFLQNQTKKGLTNSNNDSILIQVVKTTDRKVGIRLTMARVSDPGLYLRIHSRAMWLRLVDRIFYLLFLL